MEELGIEPATSLLEVRHADNSTNATLLHGSGTWALKAQDKAYFLLSGG